MTFNNIIEALEVDPDTLIFNPETEDKIEYYRNKLRLYTDNEEEIGEVIRYALIGELSILSNVYT